MGWAKDVDYDSLNKLILEDLKQNRKKKSRAGVARDVVFLMVLRNGCRVSEAMEFLYLKAKGYDVSGVRLRKRSTKEYRPIKLPREITDKDLKTYLGWLSVWAKQDYTKEDLKNDIIWREFHRQLAKAAKFLYPNPLQINTTTLRHAWIKKQLASGVNLRTIKKITGLRRFDHILRDFDEHELLG